MFANFNTASSQKIEQFTAILKSATKGSCQTTTSQGSASNITSPPTPHLQYQNSSNMPSQTTNSVNTTSTSNIQLSCRTSIISSNVSFLELCVNTEPHLKSLAEINTENILKDGDLFRNLGRQYIRLRQYRSRSWLLKPAAVSFVRVSSLSQMT